MSHDEVMDELALRLIYEVVFDIIPLKCLENATWMDPTLRDPGHHRRMQLLLKQCSKYGGIDSKYPWIVCKLPFNH